MATTGQEEQEQLLDAAVEAYVARHSGNGGYKEMAQAVEEYMAAMAGYDGDEKTVIAGRDMAAQKIALRCIRFLDREQMTKLSFELIHIWKNPRWPREKLKTMWRDRRLGTDRWIR